MSKTVVEVLINQQEAKLGRKLTYPEVKTQTESLIMPYLMAKNPEGYPRHD